MIFSSNGKLDTNVALQIFPLYLQEILSHDIYSNRRSTTSFVFKGSTALSKF